MVMVVMRGADKKLSEFAFLETLGIDLYIEMIYHAAYSHQQQIKPKYIYIYR